MGHPVNRELEEHLFRCWNEGMNLKSTALSVYRVFHIRISKDEVRVAFANISSKLHKPKPPPPPPPAPEKPKIPDFGKDYGRKCEVCDATPVVSITGMCGPCTFGEADTADGNW